MSEQENRLSYAVSFVSYLLRNFSDKNSIDKIILYGSVAKNQSSSESDIDIFLELKKITKKSKENVELIVENFYNSKEAIIFKLLGVSNDINIKIGKLNDWPDLKRSIMSDGVVLFDKIDLREKSKGNEHKIIFFWDKINNNRTAFLNKLYGYKTKEVKYVGLLERWSSQKLGKSCIIIPIKYRDEFVEVMKKYKVQSKSVEVFI